MAEINEHVNQLIECVNSIPRLSKNLMLRDDIVPFLCEIELSLRRFPDEKDQKFILQMAAKKTSGHVPESCANTWKEFRNKIFNVYGVNESEIEVSLQLETVVMGSRTLDEYFIEVKRLVTDLILRKCEATNWNDISSIKFEMQQKGMDQYIDGLDTVYATYVTLKAPKSLDEAHLIVKNRLNKMGISNILSVESLSKKIEQLETELIEFKALKCDKTQNTIQPIKMCRKCHQPGHIAHHCPNKRSPLPKSNGTINLTIDSSCKSNSKIQNKPDLKYKPCQTLALETDLNDSRKYLFFFSETAPVNLINHKSLPLDTKFTKEQRQFSYHKKVYSTIGKLWITLDFDKFKLKRQFYVYKEDELSVEEDGILQWDFGGKESGKNCIFFTRECSDGMLKLEMGSDCPKKGICGHQPEIPNLS